ncbi:accessory protein regulator B [Oxobacter pfennigii]|uniref:Accessory protein regulator B n=1 Tax=Oxobacter pfennigii TaxID=36849 RepID=A0A0P8W794_9CLOT|nr:accessory gene regulator B family protein [Oxobacter pfennigii]KPU44537.1 accessory protein regulator B [Oxobacter pfennigii]
MSVHRISKFISSKISRELSLPSDKQEIIEYGTIGLISELLSMFSILVTALIFNMVFEAAIITFCSAFLRKYSGGAHCSSPLRCALLGAVVVPVLVLLGRLVGTLDFVTLIAIIVFINLICITIFSIYSPVDSPSKPIKNIHKRKILRLKAVTLSVVLFLTSALLLYLNFGQVSALITMGMSNQALTLTKPGHVGIKFFDKLLSIVNI